MKSIIFIIPIFLIWSCNKSIFDLNKSIIVSRKEFRNENFKRQLHEMDKFREDFLQLISKKYNLNIENRKDTLILVEYFDNICPTCNYYEITLLNDNIAFKIDEINWKKKATKHKIKIDTVSFYTHSNLIGDGLWKLKINKSKSNPFNSGFYSCHCFDGSRANITWILPNRSSVSIHADCFL